MKSHKKRKFLGPRLKAQPRIWENLNQVLRIPSESQTDHQVQHNHIRDEIMEDLQRRPDHRPIISLPGTPE